jgi:alpha/beta superfamily hydrolase
VSEVRKLWLPGPAGRLEGALRVAREPKATVVVAHPHPQHGGTLDNAVVFHTERELHRLGMTTLRFNFRGVGGSEGQHDDGRGEVDDVAAAVAWLRGLADDVPALLCGYSFGSWCALRYALGDRSIAGVVALGLPVDLYDVTGAVAALGRPLLVVQAEADEFGSPEAVRAALSGALPPASLRVIPDTTHLFPGKARDVAAEVVLGVREWADTW